MTKKIKELKPGETFLDSFGLPLVVEKIVQLEWSGTPRTSPKTKVFFTSNGKSMFMNFPSDRDVKLSDFSKAQDAHEVPND